MRRRWLGVAFLATALVMLVAGETIFKGRLSLLGSLLFWLVCFVCTIVAVIIAFLDVRAMGREVSKAQRELFNSTLKKIELDAQSKNHPQRNTDASAKR